MKRNKAYLIAFGKNLKLMLEARGKSPDDVAVHGNMEPKNVYRAINGEHSTGISIIYSIAQGLGVEPKDLFDFEFPEKE